MSLRYTPQGQLSGILFIFNTFPFHDLLTYSVHLKGNAFLCTLSGMNQEIRQMMVSEAETYSEFVVLTTSTY